MTADMPTETSAIAAVLARLGRARWATRAAIIFERLWPLALPLIVVAGLFLSLSWFGLFRMTSDWLRLVLLAGFALAALAALWPLRGFRTPSPGEVDRRIERANRLEHTPVSVQSDRLAGGDAFAAALWHEHRKRMAGRLARLSGDTPRTRMPERDPWGLRALTALVFVTAFAFSFGPYGGNVTDAFHAGIGRTIVPPRVDAWVTPPTYTGRAPLFLTSEANREAAHFTVPAGSTVSVRVSGGSGSEGLAFVTPDGTEEAIPPQGDESGSNDPAGTAASAARTRQFSDTLENGGTIRLSRGAATLHAWSFTVTPDRAPTIRFTEEPSRAANGTLELAYAIDDDYGAASARALFELAERDPQAHALYEAPDLPLTLPRRGARDDAAQTTRDLTEHPWAGRTVKLTLRATDDAGQTGRSETKTFTLPQRPFTNPLARAVVEQRRVLALDAHKKPRVMDLMDATTLWPEETFDKMRHYLALVSVRSRLDMAQTDDELRDVVDYMWDVALHIENGDLTDAEKRLSQARQALREALERGADQKEIERLMSELRQAMQDYLREFAERAMQNRDMTRSAPDQNRTVTQRDIDRMLDEIEDLAKSGARERAEQLLSRLENMLNNLQAGRPQQGRQGGPQSEMRQQMDQLGEIMRRQQEMMNETFGLNRQQQGQQGQQGQPGQPGQEGQQGQGQGRNGMSAEELAEALRQLQEGQGRLRSDLEDLQKSLREFGIEPGEGFGEAGKAMGEAEGALGRGEGERAVGEQGRALEALRRGAQDMMNRMRQAMQGQQGNGMRDGGQRNADRDPLGRPRATRGPDFGESVDVPDEIDIQRARRILEAIRKRLGDALSPAMERDYLERLLDMQ